MQHFVRSPMMCTHVSVAWTILINNPWLKKDAWGSSIHCIQPQDTAQFGYKLMGHHAIWTQNNVIINVWVVQSDSFIVNLNISGSHVPNYDSKTWWKVHLLKSLTKDFVVHVIQIWRYCKSKYSTVLFQYWYRLLDFF